MSPSRGTSIIDITALSGILGSISIACWIVVFTPQIVENFRRSSADALSLTFIIIWLAGDVFNILGAILQGVLPTMVILAVYYTVADIVLLGQCVYYRGFYAAQQGVEDGGTSAIIEDEETIATAAAPTERAPLLASAGRDSPQQRRPMISDISRSARGSMSSFHSYISSASGGVDATHLSPATPFAPPTTGNPTTIITDPSAVGTAKTNRGALKTTIFDITALIAVCAAGALGWYISSRAAAASHPPSSYSDHDQGFPDIFDNKDDETGGKELRLDFYGQIFGYLCAILYLGSRVPQLLLNHRRKSTEGVSMLFFLFACVGNATYVGSILAHEPACVNLETMDPAGVVVVGVKRDGVAGRGNGGGSMEGMCW